MPDQCDEDTLLSAIAERAQAADRHDGDLTPDIDDLRAAGWLSACLPVSDGGQGWGSEPSGTEAAFNALRQVGRASLSVARLFEGHMNATKLVTLYASRDLRDVASARIRDGDLFGVWGADDPECPLTMEQEGASIHLSGVKRFASGLGLVRSAIVSIMTDDGLQLLVVPVDDPQRTDPSAWAMGGMRATRSGRYDFTGLMLSANHLLGEPGDYLCEPHFEGGIWRYCAAHLGAAEALYAAMRDALTERDRADDPHQQRRVVEAATAVETARLWLLRAAGRVEEDEASKDSATLSRLAREVTEQACLLVMDRVESAIGMAAYADGSRIERICRDLRLFLRQAGPDAKRTSAAKALIANPVLVENL